MTKNKMYQTVGYIGTNVKKLNGTICPSDENQNNK